MNKFSLRRVKNSCYKNISAAVPHGSVIYQIDYRRKKVNKYRKELNLLWFYCILPYTPGFIVTKALNSVAGSPPEWLIMSTQSTISLN